MKTLSILFVAIAVPALAAPIATADVTDTTVSIAPVATEVATAPTASMIETTSWEPLAATSVDPASTGAEPALDQGSEAIAACGASFATCLATAPFAPEIAAVICETAYDLCASGCGGIWPWAC